MTWGLFPRKRGGNQGEFLTFWKKACNTDKEELQRL